MNFSLRERETLAILGESGSGKSVTAQAIMGILDTPPAHITGGSITYCGMELLTAPARTMQDIRGEHIAMIFQDPMMTLNPVLRIDTQMIETVRAHGEGVEHGGAGVLGEGGGGTAVGDHEGGHAARLGSASAGHVTAGCPAG